MELFELVPWANWMSVPPGRAEDRVTRKVWRIVAALASERVESRFLDAILSGLPEDLPLRRVVGTPMFAAACRILQPWLGELSEWQAASLLGRVARSPEIAVLPRAQKLLFVRFGPSDVVAVAGNPPPASGWLRWWDDRLVDNWYASTCWAHVVLFPDDMELGEIRRAHVWLRQSRSAAMMEGHHGPVASAFPARGWARATAQFAAPIGDFFVSVRDDEEAEEVADAVLRRDCTDPVGVMVVGDGLSGDGIRRLWRTGRIAVFTPGCGQAHCSVEIDGKSGFRLEVDGELRGITTVVLARAGRGEVEIATTVRTVVAKLPALTLVAEQNVYRMVNGGLGMYRPVLPV